MISSHFCVMLFNNSIKIYVIIVKKSIIEVRYWVQEDYNHSLYFSAFVTFIKRLNICTHVCVYVYVYVYVCTCIYACINVYIIIGKCLSFSLICQSLQKWTRFSRDSNMTGTMCFFPTMLDLKINLAKVCIFR